MATCGTVTSLDMLIQSPAGQLKTRPSQKALITEEPNNASHPVSQTFSSSSVKFPPLSCAGVPFLQGQLTLYPMLRSLQRQRPYKHNDLLSPLHLKSHSGKQSNFLTIISIPHKIYPTHTWFITSELLP